MGAPSLDDLIGLAERRTPSGLPLDRLGIAVTLSRELSELSDGVVNHFVQEARRAGCSWAQIGDVLGVSRQAAQQRFVGRWLGRVIGRAKGGSAPRWLGFTDRARRVVELAQEEARRLDHHYVGTEHLLLGVLRQPKGVGAMALEALGISPALVRKSVEAKIGRGGDAAPARLPIPFTPRARKALDMSVAEAKGLGHNYVGTEHIVLALAGIGGVAADILQELGAGKDRIREHVLRLLAA